MALRRRHSSNTRARYRRTIDLSIIMIECIRNNEDTRTRFRIRSILSARIRIQKSYVHPRKHSGG